MKMNKLQMHNAIMEAVTSYSKGTPVVVLSPDESVLHGKDTLKAIVELGCDLQVNIVRDIDRGAFEATDYPEILEAARRVWLERGGFSVSGA
jgi:hypothetical protein